MEEITFLLDKTSVHLKEAPQTFLTKTLTTEQLRLIKRKEKRDRYQRRFERTDAGLHALMDQRIELEDKAEALRAHIKLLGEQATEVAERISNLKEETVCMQEEIETVTQVLFEEANQSVSKAARDAHETKERLNGSIDRLQKSIAEAQAKTKELIPSLRRQNSDPELRNKKRLSVNLGTLPVLIKRASSMNLK